MTKKIPTEETQEMPEAQLTVKWYDDITSYQYVLSKRVFRHGGFTMVDQIHGPREWAELIAKHYGIELPAEEHDEKASEEFDAFPPSKKEIDGLYSISYYEPFGKYREFDLDKDVFPGIPLNITPVYILETEQWTFVWAFDVDREYVYEWDKVSVVYSFVKRRDRK
jgi:hypothetical protein